MTITEFLTARYDEEEGTSVSLSDGSVWQRDMPIWSDLEVAGGDRTVSAGEHSETMRVQEHWTARVLTDIAAKRAIVAEYVAAEAYYRAHADAPAGELTGLRTAVHMLAQPYANHPDFDESWKL